jgi:hypothetical protein
LSIYAVIKSGALRLFRCGGRRIIYATDLARWLRGETAKAV